VAREPAPSELLLDALFRPGAGPGAWAAWTRHADRYGCDSESARLLPLAYRRRRDFGVDGDEPWIARAADRYRATFARNHLLLRSAAAVVARLQGPGIEVMPVKGIALLERFYADVGARPMLDVDLLVRAACLPQAVAALTSGGWTTRSEAAADFPVRAVEITGPDGREIDLHRSLFLDPTGDRDEEGRWARSTPGTLAGTAVRDGHAADLLLHVIAHGTHRFLGVSARWVPDALAILGAGDFDFELFVDLAAGEGLGPPAAAALAYLHDLAGVDVDRAVLRALRAAPASWLTRRSFRAAPAGRRWDLAGVTPAGTYALAALVDQRGPRAGADVARRMVLRNHGSAGAWIRWRWRRAWLPQSRQENDASIQRALGGGVDR